jgi:7-carboxy-7-deazaguanine synthase
MMRVDEIFRSIQGEGHLTGIPMTVIRLYGCNLSCPFCDTPQEDYQGMSVDDIVGQVKDDWALLTGGEPTIRADLRFLVQALREIGIRVALETNGTGLIPEGIDWVCVSPITASFQAGIATSGRG